MKEATRYDLVKICWAYIKGNKLKDSEAKQWITPDRKMAKVFGKDKLKGFIMTKFFGTNLKGEVAA